MAAKNTLTSPEDVQRAFEKISKKIAAKDLKMQDLKKLKSLRRLGLIKKTAGSNFGVYLSIYVVAVAAIFGLFFYNGLHTDEGMTGFIMYLSGFETDSLEAEECLVEMLEPLIDAFRPPCDCAMCRNLTSIPVVSGISSEYFEDV